MSRAVPRYDLALALEFKRVSSLVSALEGARLIKRALV